MRRRLLAAAGVALVLSFGTAVTATADPPDSGSAGGPPPLLPDTSGAPRIANIIEVSATRTELFVDSPAMQRTVRVDVLHPSGDAPRPSFYLLDGVDAGDQQSTWTAETDIVSFFANKNVNVVLPVGGAASYYTDWKRVDPVLGVNAWESFLTEELPPLIDAEFRGTGANAVGGLSMGGHAAMNLITRHPDLYRGVAAYSSCPDSTNANARNTVRATVASKGGDANNMWGPNEDPDWVAHDPVTNAGALRGKTVYMSVGNGLPGPHELRPDAGVLAEVISGAGLEWAAMTCTRDFQARMDALRIPGNFVYRPVGTHTWPYWQDDLHHSWPTIAAALG